LLFFLYNSLIVSHASTFCKRKGDKKKDKILDKKYNLALSLIKKIENGRKV
jgi:hypothetical protein